MSYMSELDITVREMLAEGFSAYEIAERLHVPIEWVQDVEFDPTADLTPVEYLDGMEPEDFFYEEEDEC